LFDTVVTTLFLSALLIISLLVMFDTRPKFSDHFDSLKKLFGKKQAKKEKELRIGGVAETEDTEEEAEEESDDEEIEEEDAEEEEHEPVIRNGTRPTPTAEKIDSDAAMIMSGAAFASIPFAPPPLTLLEGDKGKPGVGDVKANANVIQRTLRNFGIDVEMDEVDIGPSVTRYAFKPAEGVRISKILSLQNNLELALAAHPVRIEAPIPGKSLVGIEVPNSTRTIVGLRSLVGSDEFQNSDKPLLFALGRGVTGKLHFADLAKMPHVLIAGTTGSGKSVMVHSLITSLLFRNPPESLRFIMVDPKRVELTVYNKTPHLLTPTITDPKKAILALKWAGKEMERRYDVLEAEGVRNIASYHKTVVEPAYEKASQKQGQGDPEDKETLPERMPYIVVVIDELADIMTAYPRELEAGIVRLAQMSRAVGIHLVLSTQRPSVNVITGLIKANIPSRIAFQVASQIDSRTILDAGGAEKLLGAGDMLYISGDMSKPARLQSSFLSEGEVKKVVGYFSKRYGDSYQHEEMALTSPGSEDSGERSGGSIFEHDLEEGDDDELYEDARALVLETKHASTSFLQRKLRIGYSRAARLMDILEEKGVIGPKDGSKQREVIDSGSSSDDDTQE
jgi:S-DNA-T family DNA segregation ATPase FtsK/SpoIIIE